MASALIGVIPPTGVTMTSATRCRPGTATSTADSDNRRGKNSRVAVSHGVEIVRVLRWWCLCIS